MGSQNNTAVAVSRFKPVQCIGCRFLTVTLCVACRSSFIMSVASFGKSDFQEKNFKISFMQSLNIVQLILKSFVSAYSFIFNVISLPHL